MVVQVSLTNLSAQRLSQLCSFAVSVFLHVLCLSIWLYSSEPDTVSKPPARLRVKVVPLSPEPNKLIWYKVPAAPPEIGPRKAGLRKLPIRRPELGMVIASLDRKAKPGNQLIWQPPPSLRLKHDLRIPNLIAIEQRSLPTPPGRPLAKPFVPPPERPGARIQAPALPSAPELAAALPLRQDVGPIQNVPSPVVNKPAARKFSLPSQGAGSGGGSQALLEAPPELAGAQGSGQLAIAVVGLQNGNSATAALPEGSLPALVANNQKGKGGRSSGGGTGRAPAIESSDLVISGGATRNSATAGTVQVTSAAAASPNPGTPEQWTEPASLAAWQIAARSSLSVALRPGTRILPFAIEARFPGRLVYTTAIRFVEGNDSTGTDWVVWYSERTPKTGDVPRLRPPVPWRRVKPGAANVLPAGARYRTTRLAAVIRASGQVDCISLLPGGVEAQGRIAIAMLQAWQFLPAVRNGEAIEVDAVIELPSG